MKKKVVAVLLAVMCLLEGCGIPFLNRNSSTAWMPEREAIITFWKPNYARGTVYNAATSNLTDILSYSDEQIDKYIEMLKFCGFTGVQLTDMCSAWSGVSGYEFANQQIRKFAESTHKHGMKATLWVWGAEFSSFGWVDKEAKYVAFDLENGYDDPEIVSTFEKYYDIYASLADCVDRVIMHFYDPGNLVHSSDVVYFAEMFRKKVMAKNPKIDFGVSCWRADTKASDYLEAMGSEITIYETARPSSISEAEDLRREVKESGASLGVWSWGTVEREVDQLAQWNYNADFIKNTYNCMAYFDSIMKPEYWSEMDSYHVLNVFSLYTAGHLLQDYSQDTDKLTLEVATATVGPENAEKFSKVLRLVEKARTGSTIDTMDWEGENYVLLSEAYPYDEILTECDELIPFVNELIDSKMESYELPLPISLCDLLRLILPHLNQIKEFAQFRKDYDALISSMDSKQISLADFELKITEIGEPISEYNATIGLWGQPEARAQRLLVLDACEKYGVDYPIYSTFDSLRKYRIYSELMTEQLGYSSPKGMTSYQYTCAYGEEETFRLMDEMVDEGILYKDGDLYYLSNWEDYIYNFNY